MYSFIVKGMRGGISYIAKRHSKANNEYMQSYDVNNSSKFNLYGWALVQYFPNSGFKWLNQRKIDGLCLNSMGENSLTGYILEVYLEYPDELNELMIIH